MRAPSEVLEVESTGKYDEDGVQLVRLVRTVQSGIGFAVGALLVGLAPLVALYLLTLLATGG